MARPRWRKVFADLWGNRTRTLLVVASIAVGTFSIGVITGAYVILSQDLNTSYLASNPANVSLLTTPFEQDLVDAVERLDGVAEAEGRREVTVRVRGEAEGDALTLVAVPNPAASHIHRLLPEQGTAVPADRQVVIERNALARLGVAVGDTLALELADGTLREMTVVGTAMDQSDVYDTILGELRAYVTFDTLEWLHQPLTMDRLYVVAAGLPDDEAHVRQVATAVAGRIERTGRPTFQVEAGPQNKHPLDSIVDALLLVLVIIGVLIAFLSGSLIANTMSALLGQHVRQIGVMKLIGARRSQVVGMYVVLIVGFGLIALLLAVPLGALGAFALSRFAANVINFVMRDFEIVPQAVAVQVAVALLLPPAAGLVPVLKGSRTSVRQAIASTGLGDRRARSGWLDRQLGRLRLVSRPLLVSIRNTFRRKGRLALTLATLTLGGAIFVAVFNSRAALNVTVEQTTRYFGADVNLDLAQSYRVEKVVQQAMRIPGVESAEPWATTGAELAHADGTPPDTVGIVAPPADTRLVEPMLLRGRWLLPGDENGIVVNEAFWRIDPGLTPGDSLRLKVAGRQVDWVVVGVFQYTGVDDPVAYANYDVVSGLLRETNRASTYRILTAEHSLAFQEQVGAQLDAHFRARGYKVSQVQAGKTLTTSISNLLGLLTAVMLAMALMTALVGSIGLTGTMSMNVMERTREIGVMRAIGAHDRVIAGLVIGEGLVIGLISYAAGALLSFPIGALLSNAINVTIFGAPAAFAFTAQGLVIWLAVVLVLSVVASLIPAHNASRLTIREVLAYE